MDTQEAEVSNNRAILDWYEITGHLIYDFESEGHRSESCRARHLNMHRNAIGWPNHFITYALLG